MSKKYLRRPQTAQEKRANQEGWNRPSRNPHLLPDAWSWEEWRRYERCWKKFRRTQYKT